MTPLKSLLEKIENKEVLLNCLNLGGGEDFTFQVVQKPNITVFRAHTWLQWQACSYKC